MIKWEFIMLPTFLNENDTRYENTVTGSMKGEMWNETVHLIK
jgi:hypothetical protein